MKLIDVIDAEQDADLRLRLIAAAALDGIRDPQTWQYENRYALVAAPISANEADGVLANIYAYARDGAQVEKPGLDPSVVTDEYVKYAVKHLLTAPATT